MPAAMDVSLELYGDQPGRSLSRAPRSLFSRRRSSDALDLSSLWKDRPPVVNFTTTDRRALLQALYEAFLRRDPMPRDIDELARAFPVPRDVLDLLQDAARECQADESRVLAAFLAWLGTTPTPPTSTLTSSPCCAARSPASAASARSAGS
jgi:hypothetical protein